LYREFGWTPSELRAIGYNEIAGILTCLQEDVKYQNRPKSKATNTLAGGGITPSA
jgi:hypothetical protein